MHGGGIRVTGHLYDVWFVEVVLGGAGGDTPVGTSLYEVFALAGLRVMGPVVPQVLRMYAALDVGITARGQGGVADAPVWGAFPIEAGGGLEVGLPGAFTAGLFLDVRGSARVPFEREPAFLGIAWSAGVAAMWF